MVYSKFLILWVYLFSFLDHKYMINAYHTMLYSELALLVFLERLYICFSCAVFLVLLI